MPTNESLYPLNKLRQENVELLYKKTVTAILVITTTYLVGAILFISFFILKSYYCFFGIILPLLGYLWLITLGSKYVNNHYGFKKTSTGIYIYIKKRHNYSTLMVIHILIFIVLSVVRLVHEINNLLLIRQQFISKSTD